MAAPESTKFQINYKLADGTLINLYAKDIKDFETGLTDLAMVASLIKSTGKEFGGAPAPAAPMSVESVAAAFNATPVAPQGGGNMCKHGAMNYRTGTNDRGTWQAWMCGSPKGTPKDQQCDPIWVR